MRKPKQQSPILLSRADVQARLGCGEKTATRLLNSGHFPNAFKFNPDATNSHWRVPETDVDAYLASLRKPAGRGKKRKPTPRVPAGA